MKNPLASLYDQVLLNEAEKSKLESPSNNTVGKLTPKQDLFSSKPEVVDGPDKAKVQTGPNYKVDGGSTSKPTVKKGSFKGGAPAKSEKADKGEEMEDTDVTPKSEEEEKEDGKPDFLKKKTKNENLQTMSAFETLFKKTLTEEVGEEVPTLEAPEVAETESEDVGDIEGAEEDVEDAEEDVEDAEDEEADLLSDLKDLQTKLAAILTKLEDVAAEEDEEDEEGSYTEDDFEDEFGAEDEEEKEAPVKESVDKPKALSPEKGKALVSKKNKVGGKLKAKGGKANISSPKNQPVPKVLGDKKGALQKGGVVKSSVSKGDFIK